MDKKSPDGIPSGLFIGVLSEGRQFNLVGVEFHAAVPWIEQRNFFDGSVLMINEHLQVGVPQHVQIDFITVIPYPHHKRTLLVQCFYFRVQRKTFEFSPRNHA